MDIKTALAFKLRLSTLTWTGLPLPGVKTDLGNGFVGWTKIDNGEECLFVTDHGKKLTVFRKSKCDNEHCSSQHLEMRNSTLKAKRLGDLIIALQTVRVKLAEEVIMALAALAQPTSTTKDESTKDEDEMPALESDDDGS